MLDKFQLIDKMITEVDALGDAKGAAKCAIIIELIQQLGALRKGLQDDDAARKSETGPVILTDSQIPDNAMEV